MKRNIAGQIVTAQLNALADGTPVATGTTTITVVKDGVGAAGVGTVSHINAGLWKYTPTQAETDAEHLTFVFSNTLAGTQAPQMYTEISADLSSLSTILAEIVSDTDELQSNQGNWLTADLSGVSTFDPANDTVSRVTLVDVTTANTDMRGTDNALLANNYTAPDNIGISEINVKATSILSDTNELQLNQVDLTPVLNNQSTINDNVLTRLASVDYIAPNNAGIASIENKANSLLLDTGTNIPALIAALENLSAVEVKAKLVEVLSSDVTVEPTNVPSDSDPILDKLNYLFAFAANKITQTANTQTLRNSLDTLDISSASISTDAITTTTGKHT